jgi:hypothetical protein
MASLQATRLCAFGLLVCASVSCLNFAGLLMQPGCTRVGLGLLAMLAYDLGIGRGLGLGLGLSLMLKRASRTLLGALLALECSIMHAAINHRRNIALPG